MLPSCLSSTVAVVPSLTADRLRRDGGEATERLRPPRSWRHRGHPGWVYARRYRRRRRFRARRPGARLRCEHGATALAAPAQRLRGPAAARKDRTNHSSEARLCASGEIWSPHREGASCARSRTIDGGEVVGANVTGPARAGAKGESCLALELPEVQAGGGPWWSPCSAPSPSRPSPGGRHLRQVQADADQGRVDLRRAAQRRRLVAGARHGPAVRPEAARREREDDVQGEHRRTARSSSRRWRASCATATRSSSAPRSASSTRSSPRSTRTCSSSRRPGPTSRKNLAEYFGAGEDSIYLSGHGRRRGHEERQDRLHRPVRDPRGDPPRERVRARRPGDAPRRDREADLDERVVRPGQGEEGRREPRRLRRRRARPERGQPGCRPVRAVEGHPVGRLRREREEVRADLVAHRGHLQLGPVLPEPGQGGHERDLEVGASTTAASRTASSPSPPTGRR